MNAEEENMWRTLQNKDHIQGWRCRWGFHKWTKWKVQSVGQQEYNGTRSYVYECFCVNCNYPRREKMLLPEERGKL